MDIEKLPAPKSIEEVGIYLSVLFKQLKGIEDKLDIFSTNFVPSNLYLNDKQNFEERMKKVETQSEKTKDFESKWAGRVWGINGTIGLILTLGGILLSWYLKK